MTDPVSAVGGGGMYATAPTRQPKQSLDSDAFMSLLVTQLRYQDPSSPMDTGQMIQQTTQLAMMEKLTSLDTTATENFALQMRAAAASLVGKQVSYLGPDGTAITGVASSVSYTGSVPTVTIGDTTVPLDSVAGVTATDPAPAAPSAATN
jgi:flagellar basal-body rod modification protein FlgD